MCVTDLLFHDFDPEVIKKGVSALYLIANEKTSLDACQENDCKQTDVLSFLKDVKNVGFKT
jgi:hypothetical protein